MRGEVATDYMARALAQARMALGHVSPNPAVGAVIVKRRTIIGAGYTQPPGSAHAEVVALEQAGEAARGATMYVTLEPCAHFGRTPPCTEAIISAGISEVHMALLDPNPLVSGRGQRQLEEAGIKTYLGEHEEEARELNEAYLKFITTSLPFVIAKFAVSLDGKIATKTGNSKWISGPEARRQVHELRHIVDAVMVGVNTVLADDPQLTARQVKGGASRQPLRVIVDSYGRTPPRAQALKGPGTTLIATTDALRPGRAKALKEAGAELLALPESEEGMADLAELLRALGQRQITSVLVEGGGALLGSLFDLRLVDKVVAFIAPIIIGGVASATIEGQGVEKVGQALRLGRLRVERVGDDVMIVGYPGKGQPEGTRE